MTFNKSTNAPEKRFNPSDHPTWAKGFMTKRQGREYHPYTHKDFKFKTDEGKTKNN